LLFGKSMDTQTKDYNKAMAELETAWREKTGNSFQDDRLKAKQSVSTDVKDHFLSICTSLNPGLGGLLHSEIYG